jgi:hypothetical protein
VVIIILFASPIVKYLIEKYDVKYTGRQIKTGMVYVNPFTGYIYIKNLKIYESKIPSSFNISDSVFFSAKGVSANFAMLKLLFKKIEISEISLNEPIGIIIQNKKDLNFNDIIRKFTPKKTNTSPSSIHFNILKIKIKNGKFYYREKITPIDFFIKDVNLTSSGKYWDTDTIVTNFSFTSEHDSGTVKGSFTINFKNMNYRLFTKIHKLDLKFIEPYIKKLINFGTFSSILDADIKATGNLNDKENLTAKGNLELTDFHFGKNPTDDYVSFNKLVIKIDELSPKNHKYLFDSLSINSPFVKLELYDYLDNIQMMFGKQGANISAAKANSAQFNLIIKVAEYIKVLAKNFFHSDYKINKLAIINGCFQFNDYSLTEKFSLEAYPLSVVADSVNRNRSRVEVYIKSGIQPYGVLSVNLSINPKDSGDYDMQYNLQKIPATIFNPYLLSYTSYPLDKGTIELNGTWKVRNGIIKSDNHFLLIDPRIGARIKNKDNNWIPAPLIMYFIRENGNYIDYEIPITGNLKNPQFHLMDVVMDIVGNLFIKPPAIPYRSEVKNIENEIENFLSLKWKMRLNTLLPEQEKFITKMADFLIHNPEASIAVYPIYYAEKEKEYIQFFEAKKRYFLISKNKTAQSFNESDSLKVDKMSVKDSLFVQFLNNQISDSLLFTLQDKCLNFIGTSFINAKFGQLNKARADAFLEHFKEKKIEGRVKIFPGINNTPYNGFSFYKIIYKGEFPESLIKAYRQMDDLNNYTPRKKYEEKRKTNSKQF